MFLNLDALGRGERRAGQRDDQEESSDAHEQYLIMTFDRPLAVAVDVLGVGRRRNAQRGLEPFRLFTRGARLVIASQRTQRAGGAFVRSDRVRTQLDRPLITRQRLLGVTGQLSQLTESQVRLGHLGVALERFIEALLSLYVVGSRGNQPQEQV